MYQPTDDLDTTARWRILLDAVCEAGLDPSLIWLQSGWKFLVFDLIEGPIDPAGQAAAKQLNDVLQNNPRAADRIFEYFLSVGGVYQPADVPQRIHAVSPAPEALQ